MENEIKIDEQLIQKMELQIIGEKLHLQWWRKYSRL